MTPRDAKSYLRGLLATIGGRGANRFSLDEILAAARPLVDELGGGRSRVGGVWVKGAAARGWVIVALTATRAGVEIAGVSVDEAPRLDDLDFAAPRALATMMKRFDLVQRLKVPLAAMRALVAAGNARPRS